MSLVGRFEHLPKRPRSDEARPLLEKIASQVKPIMVKRGWKVGTLAEFFPSNPSLLGLNTNAGQRINLRLRPPSDPGSFYEYDQLVLVMLHELTHNVHGPHDAQFYRLLGEIEEEYHELKRKGYSGDGFHSNGQHLAGIKRTEYDGRRVGLAAAEKRLAVQRMIGKGGKLGGGAAVGKTLREAVAEAAERRIRDDKTCGTSGTGTGAGAGNAGNGHSSEAQEAVREAQEESVGVDAVDLPDREWGPDDVGASEVDHSSGNSDELGIIDQKGSASRSSERRVNGTDSERGDVGEVIDLTESPPHSPIRSGSPTDDTLHLRPPSRPSIKADPAPSRSSTRINTPTATPSPSSSTATAADWTCDTCTLINPLKYLACDACGSTRPSSVGLVSKPDIVPKKRTLSAVHIAQRSAGGWTCSFCAAGGRDWESWMCGDCGWVRNFG